MWMGVGRPCPPVRNNIVTPRHLFIFFRFAFCSNHSKTFVITHNCSFIIHGSINITFQEPEKPNVQLAAAAAAAPAVSALTATPSPAEEIIEKPPKRRMKMPTAAETAEAAAAATAAAAAAATAAAAAKEVQRPLQTPRQLEPEEAALLTEMSRITRVLDDKLDILDAFEVEARLRLSGVEAAVKAVEKLAASSSISTSSSSSSTISSSVDVNM